jgi:hypothetical protein
VQVTTAPPATRPPRLRGRVLVAALVALCILIYVAVVTLYAINDKFATITGCTGDPPSDSVLLQLTPESVDASRDRIVANLSVLSFGPIGEKDSGLLADPLTVLVSDTDGPRSYTFAADEFPSPVSVNFITTGFIEQWPFDTHTVDVTMLSLQTVAGETSGVPTQVCGSAHVPGWTFDSQAIAGTEEIQVNGQEVPQMRITATRSIATVAFGIVILALMAVLPVLALTVAIAAYRGTKRAEPTLMSWVAALLFATIPLRTFLPGSPPIGSWVDYLVVLWVVAGLVVALVIDVRAWLKWSAPGPRAAADPPPPHS